MNIDELLDQYHAALQRQAAANTAEAEADETRRIVLAKQIIAAGEVPVTKGEVLAKASEPYALQVGAMIEAKREAEEARAEVEYYRARWETWRSKMSMQKVKMQAQ